MKLDNTLLKIIGIIQEVVKEKYKLELSTQEIAEVVQTQIEVTKEGISKGISVTWYRFCKFIYTERGKRKSETNKAISSIEEEYQGLPDVIKTLKNEVILNSAERKKQLLAKGKEQSVGLKAEEVKKVESVNKVNITLFKQINSKHSK